MSTPLVTSVSATFDANGNAQAIAGPNAAFHKWHVKRFVTSCSVSTDIVTHYIYRNYVGVSFIVDSTYQGVQATSETDLQLDQGEILIATWTGGTPGSIATLNITGEDIYSGLP